MDATSAPHLIPSEMPQYGEANHIFELMQSMLEQLLIHQPQDPIPFMIEHLHRDNDHVPKIIILGPPASGKTTIAMWLCKHLSTNLLTRGNLIGSEFSSVAAEARKHYQKCKKVPDSLLIRLVQERLTEEDCVRRGWILDGIPQTREQVLMMQTLGFAPRHVIVLNAPDSVLIERNLGKRIDPVTREIYHTTFDWPPEAEVQNRLLAPEGISEVETARKLLEYHRNIIRILPSYPRILKAISADQPCVDVFYQALTYVLTSHRSNAPFTPRVLLCGPTGSGKSLQAALLAEKYGLVNVCCGQLLKEAVKDQSKLGELIQSYFDKEMPVPDNVIVKVLKGRLDQPDCVQRGWVLHGFPQDLDQAHMLASLGYSPNRYHLMYKPPPTLEIQARLLQNPKDAEDQVRLQMDLFYRNLSELEQFFKQAITVNGDQDPYTVFEYIESGIINPLPKKVF
ncbi:adenylate kinase 8 isoform X4 [Fukomys damarensis]|uniref:adenylate kinase 8 isoform X4 n=1 Tax=Fukomys damarensis TaxID=885580 RepID=UPI00053FACDB|nr:adenylate kinase 8 isoform X4 [Fukomys damarensis]